eukprot:CAMPEP_0194499960 /NCGR_PEP_ID=MMETSP0253-20130528/16098_1 /TAXON_ID=2966 /ORGANISM="Noctiluca scintillans" /LENGTH=84 /DNA_ID=CAMNT_0039341765 /DNA_START=562 /DNA_END=813 /DNA_ORIENTATION=-
MSDEGKAEAPNEMSENPSYQLLRSRCTSSGSNTVISCQKSGPLIKRPLRSDSAGTFEDHENDGNVAPNNFVKDVSEKITSEIFS